MTLFGNLTLQQQSSGIFGGTNPSQQQQTAGGSLFGSTTSQQPSATGGGLFGSTTQPTTVPAGGNIFGSTTQPAATGSIFGSTAQAPVAGSIFGGTQPAAGAAQPVGGSLFGATNTQQSQQQPAGGALFGATTTQPQSSGGSIFGASTNVQHQPSIGGLFGTTNATTQPTTNLFGATTAATPAQGSGLFGTSVSSSNPLFGNKPPSSIFGAPTNGTSTISPPTLFGQSQPQASSNTVQPTTSFFGQSVPQQPQKPAGSLFGSTTQPPTTGTLFGSTLAAPTPGAGLGTGSNFGTSTSRSSQSTFGAAQQQDPQSQFVALIQRIDAIAEAWNPNSPLCRFQHYFYNLVDPALVSQYGRSANATNEALWQRAIRENPDPSCMVPVLAVGFDALNARVEAQSAQASAQQEKLKELKKRVQALTAMHTDTTLSRLYRALSQHSLLSQRLLGLVQHLHLLIPAVRSSSIRPEEEALRVALEEIEEDLRRPGGMSKMRSKLNELWALLGAINAVRERGKRAGGEGGVEWTVVDEEGLKQITQILSDQQAGLQHLTKILQQDLKDLGVIMGTGGEREDGHSSVDVRLSASPSGLNSSTSTLHASALR